MTADNRSSRNLIPAEQTPLGLPADTSRLDAWARADDGLFVDLLRVNGKTGVVAYGQEDTELPAHAKLAAIIPEIKIGYIDWEDGQNVSDAWINITEADKMKELRQSLGKLDQEQWPERDQRGKPKDPFRESVRLPLFWINERKPLMFTSSSTTGYRAVRHLVKECLKHAQFDQVAIITIEVASYQHQQYGDVFYPIFNIVNWMKAEQVARLLNGHNAPSSGDEPQPRRSAAEKPRKVTQAKHRSAERKDKARKSDPDFDDDINL
jgi:hypothetical protein